MQQERQPLFNVLRFELASLGCLREAPAPFRCSLLWVSLARGCLRGASAPLPQPPPLLDKERGTQGVRSPDKNYRGSGDRSPNNLCPEFTITVTVL